MDKKVVRFRSAVSGRFVTKKFATKNPKTTVSETRRPKEQKSKQVK